MKCDSTNCILTFVLGVLLVISVLFALRTISHTHELRSLTIQASQVQTSILQMQSLINDVAVYNQRTPSPELTKLLQSIQAKPTAH
jgi:hypothetical protein